MRSQAPIMFDVVDAASFIPADVALSGSLAWALYEVIKAQVCDDNGTAAPGVLFMRCCCHLWPRAQDL